MRGNAEYHRKIAQYDDRLVWGQNAMQVTNPSVTASLLVPTEIKLSDGSGDRLEWREDEGADPVEVAGCLATFLKLADARDDQLASEVLKFARRWGVLGLRPKARVELTKEKREVVWLCEPCTLWRGLARRLRAVLDLGIRLYEGESPSKEEWRDIDAELFTHWDSALNRWEQANRLPPPVTGDVKSQRKRLEMHLTELLLWMHAPPVARWDGDRLSLRLDTGVPLEAYRFHGERFPSRRWKFLESADGVGYAAINLRPSRLFRVLIVQLVGALTTREGRYPCTRCGILHERARRPRRDKPNCYCEKCRQLAHNEDARRSREQRQAQPGV